MASRHPGSSAVPKKTISPAMQTLQQKLASKSTPYITAKDLQDVMAESTERLMLAFQKLCDKQCAELCEKFSQLFKCCGEHIDRVDGKVDNLEAKIENLEKKLENMEENVEYLQNDIVMAQYNQMEFALRIRGLKEDGYEKLKEKVATSLALVLGCEFEIFFKEIQKIYRINSRIALQRNLPRDVVVYFSRKDRRNEIIQTFYQQKFQIANQDIILLKEIPHKMLQKRRDFAFLTQELRNRQIPFRWNIPIGIMVTFDNKRYRLKTLQEAKEFYSSVLNAEKSPLPSFQADFQNLQLSEVRECVGEQRMTRAAYRRKVAGDKEKKGT